MRRYENISAISSPGAGLTTTIVSFCFFFPVLRHYGWLVELKHCCLNPVFFFLSLDLLFLGRVILAAKVTLKRFLHNDTKLSLFRLGEALFAAASFPPAGTRLSEAGFGVLPAGVDELVRPAFGVIPPSA